MLSTLDAAWRKIPDSKLLPRSVYDVLTQISNDFQWSLYRVQCRQTLAVAVHCVWCRHGVTNLSRRNKATSASDCRPSAPWVLQRWKADPIFTRVLLLALSFRRRFPLLFFIRHLYLSVTRLCCSLNALSSISWVDTPLTADWLQVCFGTRPRLSFLKRFWKITYPTFNCSMLHRG